MTRDSIVRIALAAGIACITLSPAAAQGPGGMGRGGRGQQPAVTGPWSDSKKSPDERAELYQRIGDAFAYASAIVTIGLLLLLARHTS